MGRAAAWAGIPCFAAAFTGWWHARWLAEDEGLPVGDAAGHLANVARHLDWLGGGALPIEPFPPGLYVVSAFCAQKLGVSVDHAAFGTVAFAMLLAATVSYLGLRASGLTAGLLLPLTLLAAPMLSVGARQVLLDLPATAAIVLVWTLAWESRGYRHAFPTILLGAALGLGALVKYTLFIWVLPALFLAGVWMVVRAPSALLPLPFAAWPIHDAFTALAMRSQADKHAALDLGPYQQVVRELGFAAGALVVAAVAIVALRRKRPGRLAEGLAHGTGLALAALLAVFIVFPWFYQVMPIVWEKVDREAVVEVRSSGVAVAGRFAKALVLRSWPHTYRLLQVAAAAETAWILWVVAARVRRWRNPDAARGSLRFGPAFPIGLCLVAGTVYTMENLPIDVRYYLPLIAGVGLLLAVAATRSTIGRWLAGPALAALFGWQLAADRGLGPTPTRVEPAGFQADAMLAASPAGPFAPPAPAAAPFARALERLVAEVAERPDRSDGAFLVAVPPFGEARSLGLEARTLEALAHLDGVPERALRLVEVRVDTPFDTTGARYLAIAGARIPGEAALVEGWTVVHEERVAGRLVALYRRPVTP